MTLPRHVALIPDGNRRWARLHGLAIEHGHRQGFLATAPTLLEALWRRGVEVTTLWLFSTDNWHRHRDEIDHLMRIYGELVERLLPLARAHGVAVGAVGRVDRLPPPLAAALAGAARATHGGGRHRLQLAIDCGGRAEILQVLGQLAHRCRGAEPPGGAGGELGDEALSRFLDAARCSATDPDLIVRTGGELRLSGFMPLQSLYSELYFVDRLFPDVTAADIDSALACFGARERRFGG